jgi:hypothetical protein
LEPHRSGDQNIERTCFDLLNRANIQVHHFGKALLGYSASGSLSPNVCAELR